jgi:hypothetical protein
LMTMDCSLFERGGRLVAFSSPPMRWVHVALRTSTAPKQMLVEL